MRLIANQPSGGVKWVGRGERVAGKVAALDAHGLVVQCPMLEPALGKLQRMLSCFSVHYSQGPPSRCFRTEDFLGTLIQNACPIHQQNNCIQDVQSLRH